MEYLVNLTQHLIMHVHIYDTSLIIVLHMRRSTVQ